MSADELGVAALLDEALDALRSERMIFLTGRYGDLGKVNAQKAAILEKLAAMLGRVPPDRGLQLKFEALITASRRNERIIAAALQGLRAAKRRIERLMQARDGAVAYAADGSKIASSADLSAHNRSA